MKILPISEVGAPLKALLSASDSIALTEQQGAEPSWIMVPIKDDNISHMFTAGRFTVVVSPREQSIGDATPPSAKSQAPAFGSGRGMLTVLAEDDAHLSDFDEYMR